jgi:hypothetical protein
MASRQPEGTSRFLLTFKFTGPENPEPTEVYEYVMDNDVEGAITKVRAVYTAEGKTIVPDSFTMANNAQGPITIA